jgi:hypothetical protein
MTGGRKAAREAHGTTRILRRAWASGHFARNARLFAAAYALRAGMLPLKCCLYGVWKPVARFPRAVLESLRCRSVADSLPQNNSERLGWIAGGPDDHWSATHGITGFPADFPYHSTSRARPLNVQGTTRVVSFIPVSVCYGFSFGL